MRHTIFVKCYSEDRKKPRFSSKQPRISHPVVPVAPLAFPLYTTFEISFLKHAMSRYIPQTDPKTGQFVPVPPGEKPPKMIAMEKKLGIDFVDDYYKNYFYSPRGQKLFAARWGVSKNLIFANNLRGNRRSWFQMLNLPKKDLTTHTTTLKLNLRECESCGEQIPLDKAHWKEHVKGGSNKSYNLLNLCPNCHRKLDRGDGEITHKCRKVLLFREIKSFNRTDYTEKKAETLLSICENIILERR